MILKQMHTMQARPLLQMRKFDCKADYLPLPLKRCGACMILNVITASRVSPGGLKVGT